MKYRNKEYLGRNHLIVLDVLCDHPGIDLKRVSKETGYSYNYVRGLIDDLISYRLLKKTQEKFSKYFVTKSGFRLIDIHNSCVRSDDE